MVAFGNHQSLVINAGYPNDPITPIAESLMLSLPEVSVEATNCLSPGQMEKQVNESSS